MPKNISISFNSHKIGDWDMMADLTRNLNSLSKKAAILSLRRWALKAEAIAKEHLSTQDLADGNGWVSLSPVTVEKKLRNGAPYPDRTLMETGTYYRAITSLYDGTRLMAFAGVSSANNSMSGVDKNIRTIDAAMINEYGFLEKGIPPRPLWQPTFEEVSIWNVRRNSPATILVNLINSKMGRNTAFDSTDWLNTEKI